MADTCWVITSGEAGMRSQALGLAEAVGLSVVEKRVEARSGNPLRRASASARWALHVAREGLMQPWPRLVVACGRASAAPALLVKRLSGGRTFVVYVQNPGRKRHAFDLVVAMPHDGIEGPNVVVVPTAIHRVTQQGLARARGEWRSLLAPAGQPVLGVLIGGDVYIGRYKSKGYRLSEAVVQQLIGLLKDAYRSRGMRAAITPSRRTSDAAKRAISEALAAEPFGTMWDERGANPFLGILGLAERLIVTGESVSMVSEALATGRPVHVLPLDGYGERQHAFLQHLADEGMVDLMKDGELDWSFPGCAPINATAEVAARIRSRLGLPESRHGAKVLPMSPE